MYIYMMEYDGMMEPKFECDWPRTSTLRIPQEASNNKNNKIIRIKRIKDKKEQEDLKTVCDKRHANKHQVKEDQTHMPLPLEGTSHATLLADVPSGKEQCMC